MATNELAKNIYEKMAQIRVELQNKQLKKSGVNAFAKFNYYTLEDILPSVNQLLLQHKMFSNFSIENDIATLTFTNAEMPSEQIVFQSPIADADIKGSTPVQCLGGVHTYLKRYLYLNAFEIVEGDLLDAVAGSDMVVEKAKITAPVVKKPIAKKTTIVGSMDELVKNLTYEQALTIKIPSGKTFKELTEENLKWFMSDECKTPLYKKASSLILEHDFIYPRMAEQQEQADKEADDDIGDVPF